MMAPSCAHLNLSLVREKIFQFFRQLAEIGRLVVLVEFHWFQHGLLKHWTFKQIETVDILFDVVIVLGLPQRLDVGVAHLTTIELDQLEFLLEVRHLPMILMAHVSAWNTLFAGLTLVIRCMSELENAETQNDQSEVVQLHGGGFVRRLRIQLKTTLASFVSSALPEKLNQKGS